MSIRMTPLQASLPFIVALATGPVRADSWMLPTEHSITSHDGHWRLTVTPRSLSSQLDYFKDADEGERRAGGVPGGTDSAYGHMQRREGDRWTEVWKAPLLNDVAPVDMLVSHDGVLVTFDNWHSMGHGNTAIVIYDGAGKPTCQWSLDDLLPVAYVNNLIRSVSSIQWRGEPSIEPDTHRVRIPVAIPVDTSTRASKAVMERAIENPEFITLGIDLQNCAVLPPKRDKWERAAAAATAAQENMDLDEKDRKAGFNAPLRVPVDADEDAWNKYLAQALPRVMDSAGEYIPIEDIVFVPADDAERNPHRRDPRSRLREVARGDSTIIVGSPSQQALVDALKDVGKEIRPGALASTTIVLVVDDEHHAQAASAIAASGARLVQVDPAKPLPQSAANIARFEKDEQERASACREREQRTPRHPRWWLAFQASM